MEIISNIALITINETLVVQIISFLIFLFLINRIMIRPLKQTMDDRDHYIDRIHADIRNAEVQLEELTRQIKVQEMEVRSEAMRLAQEMEVLGSDEADEIYAEVRKTIDKQITDTQAAVDAQIAEASQWIKKESEMLSAHIIENLLERKLVQ